jgi:hypothetical protein
MTRQLIHDSSSAPDESNHGTGPPMPHGAARRSLWTVTRVSTIAALRYLWAFPTTSVGLLLLLPTLLTGGGARRVQGVLEIHGGLTRFLLRHCTLLKGGASALTLGHVVLALDPLTHDLTRDHERVHVRQCERWGPLFLPAYVIASVVALARGKHFYFDNAFEREAYDRDH